MLILRLYKSWIRKPTVILPINMFSPMRSLRPWHCIKKKKRVTFKRILEKLQNFYLNSFAQIDHNVATDGGFS